jgi:autotransporter-associated beta strand protein
MKRRPRGSLLFAAAATVIAGWSHRAGAGSFLFDASKAEMAGNADWVIDADLRNIGNSGGAMVPGFGSDSNPQQVPTPAASGITAGTAETYWSGGISAWGVAVVKLGHGAETLPYNGSITFGNGANPQDLSNYSVFVVCEPNILFTAAQKTALLNFVAAGGGLMIVSDHINSDRNSDGFDSPEIWNDLFTNNGSVSNPFGMSFNFDNIVTTSSEISTSAGDPLVDGAGGPVAALEFHNGATMTINTAANPSVRASVWKTAAHGNNEVMAGYATYGAGRVVAIGDSSPADDGTGDPNDNLFFGWDESSNGELLTNASDWLVSTPSVKYWDPDANEINNDTGTGAGLGGMGTWNSLGAWQFADGATAIYQWNDAKPGAIMFAGTSGTVTLGGTRAATALTFATSGYQLTGGTLALSGAASIDVPSGTATISSALSGSAGLAKSGAGTLIFGGSSSLTGTAAINAGTVELAGTSWSNVISMSSGTTLRGTGTAGAGGNIAIAATAGVTFATSGAGDVLTLSGVISGSGSTATITGAGTVVFSGSAANTFAGASVASGTLRLNKSTANGAIPGNVSINSTASFLVLDASEQIANGGIINVFNGTFDLNGFNETINQLAMSAGVVTGGGTITLSGATTSGVTTFATGAASQISANLNLNGTQHTFNIINALVANDTVIDGVISNGTLFKNNAGTLVLAGSSANTFSAMSFVSGTILLQKSASGIVAAPGDITVGDGSGADILRLGQSEQIGNTAAVTLTSSGTFDLATFTETIGNLTSTGGQVTGGAGTLVLGGNVTTNASAATANIAPSVDLGNAARTFSIANGAAASDLTVSGLVVNGVLNKTGTGTLTVSGAATSPQNLTINLNAGGLVIIQTQQLDALNIAAGLTATFAADGTRVLAADALTITGTGKLDLTNNKLITTSAIGSWNGSNYDGITGMIKSGRNGSALPLWDGSGIVTSMSDATTGLSTTLAIATAGQVGKSTFGGVSVTLMDVLVMYTYGGDANLSGFVDADDYFQIDSNYNKPASTLGFAKGDFDLNGVIDGDDYAAIDAGYSASEAGPPFAPGAIVGGATAVPEPACVSVVGAAALIRPRRRRPR